MPPKTTPKAPLRARRSKEEVDKEYAVIRQEVAAEQAATDPKADAAARAHQADVREAAAVVTVENVVQNIAALGLDLSAALGNVGARLGEQTRLLTAQIAALESQLAQAKGQVQEIAVRAIDGASGAKALSHINQIAIEQAKNRPQS